MSIRFSVDPATRVCLLDLCRTTRYSLCCLSAARPPRYPRRPLPLTCDRWCENPVTDSGGGAGLARADHPRPSTCRQIGRFSVRAHPFLCDVVAVSRPFVGTQVDGGMDRLDADFVDVSLMCLIPTNTPEEGAVKGVTTGTRSNMGRAKQDASADAGTADDRQIQSLRAKIDRVRKKFKDTLESIGEGTMMKPFNHAHPVYHQRSQMAYLHRLYNPTGAFPLPQALRTELEIERCSYGNSVRRIGCVMYYIHTCT